MDSSNCVYFPSKNKIKVNSGLKSTLGGEINSNNLTLNKPLDLSHHFNNFVKKIKPSPLKELYKYYHDGIKNIAGGMPFPAYFPFDTLEAKIATSRRFFDVVNDRNSGKSERVLLKNSGLSGQNPLNPGLDLAGTLQYSNMSGFPILINWLAEFSNVVHSPAYDSPGIILTTGASDGLQKVLRTFSEQGDNILLEAYSFTNSFINISSLGLNPILLKLDHDGIIPEYLEDILKYWNVSLQGKIPKLLYTIPVGQNPTGVTLTYERKKKIYDICSRYDILIIEDDPYYYIQYQVDDNANNNNNKHRKLISSGFKFIDKLVPSFLNFDKDGRVIRLDTFSKTIAPGCRLGWITAQEPFISKILLVTENTTMFPSGFVQSLVADILINHYKIDGWIDWLQGLSDEYLIRRDVLVLNLLKGKDTKVKDLNGVLRPLIREILYKRGTVKRDELSIAEFLKPTSGMFLWLKININLHPCYTDKSCKKELMDGLWKSLADHNVLVCPGWIFAPTDDLANEYPEFLRLCFTGEDIKVLEEASDSIVRAIYDFWIK